MRPWTQTNAAFKEGFSLIPRRHHPSTVSLNAAFSVCLVRLRIDGPRQTWRVSAETNTGTTIGRRAGDFKAEFF
jgi:hypothetical protein